MRLRAGKWEVRIAVPIDVRPLIGKTVLTERLCADRELAKRQAPITVARFYAQIDDARATLAAGHPSVREVARLYFDHMLASDDEGRLLLGNNLVAELQSATVAQRLVRLRMVSSGRVVGYEAEMAIGHAIDSLVGSGIVKFPPSTAERPEMLKALAQVQIDIISHFEERNRGSAAIPTPRSLYLLPDAEGDATAAPVRLNVATNRQTLVEALALFHAERMRAGKTSLAPATANEHVVTVRMFGEAVGRDRPVSSLTKADVIKFKNSLMHLPNRYTMRFPGMTIPQAIAANDKRLKPFEALDSGTINAKYLSHLRAILKWCVANDYLPANPADGVRIDEGNGYKEPTRTGFLPDDLQQIFGTPLFANPKDYGSRQWALLVALYTGARSSSETRRIKLSDIRKEQGIWVFDLIEASKNVQSKRLVPLHQKLLDLGLLTYVENLKRLGKENLFWDWEPDDKINRWFLRTYKSEVGIDDKRKVFHSFRNTLKTALARYGVPHDIRELIAGHKDQSAGAVYIADPSVTMISAMRDGLNKVEFDILVKI